MRFLNKSIKVSILTLFLITPLLFSFSNSELFEIPKMHFIYLLTALIVSLHLINWSLGQTKLFNRNPLNWFLLAFLVSQIVCTLTSIDIYTSIHGYYSRLNGGLISIITFTFLFLIIPLYLNEEFQNTFIDLILLSGFFVATFGILEHFGIDKNLWVQDVQSRVFSTLGQPNWLAAYLCILLPFSIHKYLKVSKNISFKIKHRRLPSWVYLLHPLILYTALLFTKSKSGILAAIISLTIFLLFNLFPKTTPKKFLMISYSLIIFLSLLISNPIKDYLLSSKNNHSNTTAENLSSDILITSSQDIRKIVWQGSLNLFKQFPIVGTGVETFAYSYYWVRPIEHNLTSEWDFLYNKAHNEYLNYLATTGLVGTIPYLTFTLAVLAFLITKALKHKKTEKGSLHSAALCSFISILITNTAGFSISVVSLFFFTLPILVSSNQEIKANLKTKKKLIPIIIGGLIYTISQITSSYLADIYFSKSETQDNRHEYQLAYKLISQANKIRPEEPNFYIHLGLLSAKMAILTQDQQYIDQAIKYSNLSVVSSPANINFWKLRAQVYYYLSSIKSEYFAEIVKSMLQASKLAPTDAKIYFSLGQFLESASLIDDAATYYQQAINLKSNYDHAYFALGQIYYDQKKYDLAKKNLELTLQYAPANTSAQKILEDISQTKALKK